MGKIIMEDGTILEGELVDIEEKDELEKLLEEVDELIDKEQCCQSAHEFFYSWVVMTIL